jgi:hypothetical protein
MESFRELCKAVLFCLMAYSFCALRIFSRFSSYKDLHILASMIESAATLIASERLNSYSESQVM